MLLGIEHYVHVAVVENSCLFVTRPNKLVTQTMSQKLKVPAKPITVDNHARWSTWSPSTLNVTNATDASSFGVNSRLSCSRSDGSPFSSSSTLYLHVASSKLNHKRMREAIGKHEHTPRQQALIADGFQFFLPDDFFLQAIVTPTSGEVCGVCYKHESTTIQQFTWTVSARMIVLLSCSPITLNPSGSSAPSAPTIASTLSTLYSCCARSTIFHFPRNQKTVHRINIIHVNRDN